METKTASTRMQSLVILFDMHTDYFTRALDGISDKDAHNRLATKANHVAWLTGSLVQERFEMAKLLGIQEIPASNDLFKDHQGIQDNVTYPSLETFKSDWKKISPLLRAAFINATDERLNEMIEMPGMKFSLFEYVTFLIYREANCIGQIALWRRLMDYPGLKYD